MPASGKILKVKHLSAGPMETINPFLFCVYHKDMYPAGNERSEVPGVIGNGQDFNPRKDFRMYHGKKIPGFPQHPHRGFETLTATLEGVVDHTDSLGNAGRYGGGDLQWMTAGSGVVHGENFPLLNTDAPNTLKLFQIWLNLPRAKKLVQPDFVMHWRETIDTITDDTNKSSMILYAGEYQKDGKKFQAANRPPENSWGADPNNHVGVYYIKVSSGGNFTLSPPDAEDLTGVSRAMYIVEGKGATICGKEVKRQSIDFPTFVQVSVPSPSSIEATAGDVEILVLQGKAIVGKGEQVVQHGPFVMNSREEIEQTFAEYRRTQFGGWPWDADAVIFPKSEGRFAKIRGEVIRPPDVGKN